MFSLGKLKLNNWCQHVEKEVVFTPGTNGIIGPNGRGKSNILAAAFTLLTGKTLTDTLPETINYGADSTQNELTFEIDGTPGAIKRKFTATRKEGNPNNRENVKSTASMKYGDEKAIKGVSAVNKALDGLAGFSSQMLQTHVFITQDTMSDLLFQPAQERLKSFMSLISDLNRAEKMRASLMAEASLFPDTELAISSNEYWEQLQMCEAEIQRLEAACNEQAKALASIDVDAAQAVINAQSKADAIDIEAMQLQIADAEKEHTQLTVTQGELDMRVQELREHLPEDPKGKLDQLKAQLATIESTRRELTRKEELETELANVVAKVDTLVVPVSESKYTDEALQAMELELAGLTVDIMEHEKVLEVLAGGNECPTCGNTFTDPEAEKAKHIQARQALFTEREAKQTVVTAEQTARHEFKQKSDGHKMWVDACEEKLMRLGKELGAITVTATEVPDGTKLTEDIQVLDEVITKLASAENESAVVASKLEGITQRATDFAERLAKALEIVNDLPTPEELQTAHGNLQQHRTYTTEKASLEGSLSAKRTEHQRMTDAYNKTKAMEERSKAVTNWKHILNSARDILHRDELPEEVLASYIGSLESACNKFLAMFGNPFAVMIGRSMDIRCTHPNGYVASARRLSAGQKCVLSVAMRFAINELFASDFGLIILDEPTAFMDDDNIEYMRELISYIRGISHTTGIQTIIITHHKELISSFDNVIRV
jgi:DNA repair exonuclease SbcCD ATPase subunit